MDRSTGPETPHENDPWDDPSQFRVLAWETFVRDTERQQGPAPILGQIKDKTVWQLRAVADPETERGTHEGIVGLYLGPTSETEADDLTRWIGASVRDAGGGFKSPADRWVAVTTGDQGLRSYIVDASDVRSIVEVPVDVIRPERLFARLDTDRIPLQILKEKTVAIIGLGSGGSQVAVNLAKGGVKSFVFIDGDRFKEHNVIRHVCGLADLGRHKTLAVKEFIQSRIPDVEIATHEGFFVRETGADIERFDALLDGVDLIVAAAADPTTNYSLDAVAESMGIPVIYGGMFENLTGGIFIRVDPRRNDVGYRDIYTEYDAGSSKLSTAQMSPADIQDTYMSEEQEDDLSQLGLGIDVGMYSDLLSKLCLLRLLAGSEHGLYPLDDQVHIWSTNELEMAGFAPDSVYTTDPYTLQIVPASEFDRAPQPTDNQPA